MTPAECLAILTVLEAGKSLPKDKAPSPTTIDVYVEALGDLPAEALSIAVQRILLEHKWATFPSIAELREAAVLTMQGAVSEISAADAWAMAYRASTKIDLDISGSADRAMAKLPPAVAQAMIDFGLPRLITGSPEFLAPQFQKFFAERQAAQRRMALMPPSVHRAIAGIAERMRLPGAAETAVKQIGVEK